jgi:hypothetical protein
MPQRPLKIGRSTLPKRPKKLKQPALLEPEPRVKRVDDISGNDFIILCCRASDNEIHIERFGVGSSNALWWVEYTEEKT